MKLLFCSEVLDMGIGRVIFLEDYIQELILVS